MMLEEASMMMAEKDMDRRGKQNSIRSHFIAIVVYLFSLEH